MKTFQITDRVRVECEWKKTRMAFKHVARLYVTGSLTRETKICYQNRTWESYEYQSVIHKILEAHFPPAVAEELIVKADDIGHGGARHAFDAVKAVCKIGELFATTPAEKAKWDKRMLGTIPGIEFPDDFDKLPVEERQKRLNAAKEVL